MGRLSLILKLMAASSLDSVFPRVCGVCRQSLAVGERVMCAGCMADLPRTGFHKVDFNSIHQRIGATAAIDIAAGWFHYYRDSDYSRIILDAKYNDRPRIAYELGRLYGMELADDGLRGRFDVLLPVPLHRDKLLRRGYNQSVEIARGLARELDAAIGDNLIALRRHDTQTRRSGIERYKNVAGSFALRNADELNGLNVAVVDDIITTGSTIHECVDAIASKVTTASINVLSLGVTHLR